jgi:predicted DNA-binding transcriptional regulator AlpA
MTATTLREGDRVRIAGWPGTQPAVHVYEGLVNGHHAFRHNDRTVFIPPARVRSLRQTSDAVELTAERPPVVNDPEHPDALVGVTETARLAGITRSAVIKSHERGRMPSPLPVAGSDVLVWHRGDIDRWLAERS